MSEAAAFDRPGAEPARFTLWPMPKLGLVTSSGGSGFRGVDAAQPETVAYERGLHEGRSNAREEFVTEVQRVVQAFGGATKQLQAERANCARVMEEHVLTLAVAVARAVIQREVTLDPALVGKMVRRALGEVSWESSVEVRMNPEDIEAVEAFFAAMTDEARPGQLECIPDPKIDRGGYVIETPRRLIDGTLDTVLDTLQQHLANE